MPLPKVCGARPDIGGYPRRWLACTASTNDAAREWAAAGAPDGVVLYARRQTNGRGQRGRVWLSPPDLGLAVSFVLRPVDQSAVRATEWAILGAMAVHGALQRAGISGLRVKWPNDILAHGKKICGILAEPRIQAGRIEFVILGIGINLGQREEDFPEELRAVATSCRMEGIASTAEQMIDALAAALNRIRELPFGEVESAWRAVLTGPAPDLF